MWWWASMKPGTIARPRTSETSAPAPAAASTASRLPTATMAPRSKAIASAVPPAIVCTTPPTKTRMHAVYARAAPTAGDSLGARLGGGRLRRLASDHRLERPFQLGERLGLAELALTLLAFLEVLARLALHLGRRGRPERRVRSLGGRDREE